MTNIQASCSCNQFCTFRLPNCYVSKYLIFFINCQRPLGYLIIFLLEFDRHYIPWTNLSSHHELSCFLANYSCMPILNPVKNVIIFVHLKHESKQKKPLRLEQIRFVHVNLQTLKQRQTFPTFLEVAKYFT